uniref:Galactinol--sucrose galactosyltransferase n=1 Tax=Chenopodium quinoa TaxID=63459 RepID=A0A803M7F5_CHEQI
MRIRISPGLDGVMEDAASVKIAEGGIGLVHPDQATTFYDSMHTYLASAGISGVKVDVIITLEYLCEDYGGRVELAKRYYKGLTKSMKKNFNGINILSSMQQCNDFFFLGTKQISMGRVADDFWGKDPYGDPEGELWLQGLHMVHCSYNSLWMGQIIRPDWDMFTSDHVCASFHAVSRAICGGPIYVSDSLGCHDFDLLKKLAHLDGTIPICQHFALPTRDCLFKSPLFDDNTVLKIWNFNKYGGVIGAFNCRGSGWDRKERRFKGYKQHYKAIKGSVHVSDIEWNQKLEALEMGYAKEYAVYLYQGNSIILMSHDSDPIHLDLNPSTFELYSFVPIKNIIENVKFAPFGLTNMYNSGGTIQELVYKEEGIVWMKIKGRGLFLAYTNKAPNKCMVNGDEVEFMWTDHIKIEFDVPWVHETGGVSIVIVQFLI